MVDFKPTGSDEFQNDADTVIPLRDAEADPAAMATACWPTVGTPVLFSLGLRGRKGARNLVMSR